MIIDAAFQQVVPIEASPSTAFYKLAFRILNYEQTALKLALVSHACRDHVSKYIEQERNRAFTKNRIAFDNLIDWTPDLIEPNTPRSFKWWALEMAERDRAFRHSEYLKGRLDVLAWAVDGPPLKYGGRGKAVKGMRKADGSEVLFTGPDGIMKRLTFMRGG